MNTKFLKLNKFFIVIFIFVSIFLGGCLDNGKSKTKIETKPEKPIEVATTIKKVDTKKIDTENKNIVKEDKPSVKNASLSQDLVVSIYYASTKEDPNGLKPDTTYPSEVKISADNREDLAKKALEMLISGPKENQKDEGFYTSIPENTSVNYVKFKDNKVIADFSKNLNAGGGSFDMTQRRSQIENTLRSIYPDKDIEIAISVDGSEDQALQP